MRALGAMLAAAALAAGCGGSDSGPPRASADAPESEDVVELSTRQQLAERFDAHGGKPRLLLVFSPT